MDRKEISKKPGDLKRPTPHNPEAFLKGMTRDDLVDALIHCLKHNDPEAFKEVLEGYLSTHNKSEIARKMQVSRNTLYWMTSPEGNPTLDVLARLIKTISQAA